MTPLPLVAFATAGMTVVMLLLWLLQLRTGNAGVVDVGWSAGVGIAGLAFALLPPGHPSRRAVAAVMVGLWRLSRHPNYYFEWLGWWTWVVLGVDASWGGLTLLGPVLMLLFLLFVTGVPATEARAAASRPDYVDYRRTTSALIPWFPRREDQKRG